MAAAFATFREMSVVERDLIRSQLQVQSVVHVNLGTSQSSQIRAIDFIVFGVPIAECPKQFLLDVVFPLLAMQGSFFTLVQSTVVPFSNDVVAGIVERALRNTPSVPHIDILKKLPCKEKTPRRQKRFKRTRLEDDDNIYLTDPPGDFEYDPKTGKVSFTMAKPGRAGIYPDDLLAFVRAWNSSWGAAEDTTVKVADSAMHVALLSLDIRAQERHGFKDDERERDFVPPSLSRDDAIGLKESIQS